MFVVFPSKSAVTDGPVVVRYGAWKTETTIFLFIDLPFKRVSYEVSACFVLYTSIS